MALSQSFYRKLVAAARRLAIFARSIDSFRHAVKAYLANRASQQVPRWLRSKFSGLAESAAACRLHPQKRFFLEEDFQIDIFAFEDGRGIAHL